MKNYTKGNQLVENIVIKTDSPYLPKLLDRIYDKWNTEEKIFNRWNTMNKWVQRYKNGASLEEMINSPEAELYGKWWADTYNKNEDEINLRKME